MTIEDGVEEINACTFENCTRLKKITIPKSVSYIGERAFQDCMDLTEVKISDAAEENNKGLETIGNRAFQNCMSLTSITIPKSVTKVGICAFQDCRDLKEVTYDGKSDPDRMDAFDECPQLQKVNVSQNYKGNKFCGMEIEKGVAK